MHQQNTAILRDGSFCWVATRQRFRPRHTNGIAQRFAHSHASPPARYSSEELSRIVAATEKLPRTYSLHRATYATLFGLIASTGLRISEALNIRLSDVQPDGVLLIRRGKGGKSRLIPLHPTVMDALNAYLASRVTLPAVDDHLFLSARMRGISPKMAEYTFRRLTTTCWNHPNGDPSVPNS